MLMYSPFVGIEFLYVPVKLSFPRQELKMSDLIRLDMTPLRHVRSVCLEIQNVF